MVAASSGKSQRPSITSGRGQRENARAKEKTFFSKDGSRIHLPFIETCTTHLQLLAAFSRLKKSISSTQGLFGIEDSSDPPAEDLRWTLFVANAVFRFQRWFRTLTPSQFQPSLTLDVAVNPSKLDNLMAGTEPLLWTHEMLPPLDVLMVFHSYVLNPHTFLQDCLRCGGVPVWKAGFPWALIAESINKTNLKYRIAESTTLAFEKQTGLKWSYNDPDHHTNLECPKCSSLVSVLWTTLYPRGSSQMEKGNTLMPFTVPCQNCDFQLSQDSISKLRLKVDLENLLSHDIAMPATLLSKGGLVPTAERISPVDADSALLNTILSQGPAREIIERIEQIQQDNRSLQHSHSIVNDAMASSLSEESIQNHLRTVGQNNRTLSELKASARRMTVVYERNMSPFGLDLVGAVMRQGFFIEKMDYFDWIHSLAVEHTVSCALQRYSGFFRVMQQNPNKTAVPTFDVDLVWHTQQLTPNTYYQYSLANCNNLFIDHDDKIVDDVLNDSFGWTCKQFEDLTGDSYDKCLCWCCAILEQDMLSPKPKDKLSSRLKRGTERS